MIKLKRFTCIIISTLFTLMLTSCHALVEDEFPDFAPVPVMNALLQANSTFRVQISMAANLSDTMPDFVDDALVVIETPNETPDTLHYSDKGWYVSQRIVKAGYRYTCKVDVPGYETMTAQTTIPLPTEIDSVIFTDQAGRGQEGEKISSVAFRIRNDQHNLKFWEVKFGKHWFGMYYDWDSGIREKRQQASYGDIIMQVEQNPVLFKEPNPLTVFCNREMNSERHWMKFNFSEYYFSYGSTDTLFIELINIDEPYYRYQKQYYVYQSAGSGGIGTTPQRYPLYTNVTNGLGLFTGFSVTKKDFK
ncbi:MAG: DUF4249 domain-containing protein [Paludibacter sp.]|nr:DUF4249 domain-containing protein [Paludibacter sp.]